MDKAELKQQFETAYHKGILHGVQLMKNRLLLACENDTPIEIDGKAYYVQSDIEHLQQIFRKIEEDAERGVKAHDRI